MIFFINLQFNLIQLNPFPFIHFIHLSSSPLNLFIQNLPLFNPLNLGLHRVSYPKARFKLPKFRIFSTQR